MKSMLFAVYCVCLLSSSAFAASVTCVPQTEKDKAQMDKNLADDQSMAQILGAPSMGLMPFYKDGVLTIPATEFRANPNVCYIGVVPFEVDRAKGTAEYGYDYDLARLNCKDL